MMDHTETVQIEFDPSKTSYEKMLQLFWEGHDPTYKKSKRQYMSGIWFHNSEQEQKIKKSKAEMQAKLGKEIVTVIEKASKFYLAEDYHQKYELQKCGDILDSLNFSSTNEMINSTVAAKINGYLGGYGSVEQLQGEINTFGLNETMKARLLNKVSRTSGNYGSCKN